MKTICIMCPNGCPLDIQLVENEIIVKGNTCKRGEEYGVNEFIAPTRSITTLVKLQSGGVASVKTSKPVPKSRIFDVINHIGKIVADDDVRIGDVIESNILGLGADVVITGRK